MKYSVYIGLMFFMVLNSCGDIIQEISWETKNIPQKVVVEGNITTEFNTHPILLRYSDDYFANSQPKGISGATISVTSQDSVIFYNENPDIPGQYRAEFPFAGKINTSYQLNIQLESEVNGTDTYAANTEIIEGMQIDSIQAELYKNPMYLDENDSLIVIVFVYGLEPEEITNFYLFKIYRNGQLLTDTINQYQYFSDQERGINGAEFFGLFVQDEFYPGDTLGIRLYSIPEEYDYFLDGINQISQPGDPFGFSGPPANAIGNINEGEGLGFYYGADFSYAETILIDKIDE